MKTLVSNKKAAVLGPILVVTFTNHALDQSLEHLLDQGIGQIIRIGGNSKSERLASRQSQERRRQDCADKGGKL
jgi:hypothetical protein